MFPSHDNGVELIDEKYFNPEDLDRVRELRGEADEKFGELIGDYEMGHIEDNDIEWLEYGREQK